ncbi:uncharacterized protein PV09_05082 [Verruconis gallopava]|uniref:Thioredoxin-like fold domain-containing protein n=1 Tax=Verruconis gallopava TaxID=253628 RepID=A0A0D2AX61_9PEZI|nr:uncharacterized protein PV09_05082 [Verruconis gallopava]KIW03779.1 hypothetical protein PV09_05082 [Verruconis gallopava]
MPGFGPSTSSSSSFLTIPAPLKRLFDSTPLIAYEENELPQRSVRPPTRTERQDIHAFFDAHVRAEDKRRGKQKEDALHSLFSWACRSDGANPKVASFNPSCLRWQTYLIFQGIEFYVVPANNHASFPSTLPILTTHPEAGPPLVQPVVNSEGFAKWVRKSQALGNREEAYLTLVDGPVRRAWQYHMYLTPNFRAITTKCYIDPQSSSSIVRFFSSRSLQEAAREDLLKTKPIIDERAIYLEAEQAFVALDTYVSEGIKSGRSPTSLLDAAIFSYVYLLLELDGSVWMDTRLVDILKKFNGLREHKELIRKNHFRARPPAIWRELNQRAK